MQDMENNVDNWFVKDSFKRIISSDVLVKKAIEMRDLKERPVDYPKSVADPHSGRVKGDGVNLTSLIDLLHEIEYKNKMLNDTTSFIHPKRRENIQARLKYFASRYFKYIKDNMVLTFNSWNTQHMTEDPNQWAENIISLVEEDAGKDGLIKYIDENGGVGVGGIYYGARDIPVNREIVKEYLTIESADDPQNTMQMVRQFLMFNPILPKGKKATLDLVDDERFINYFIQNVDNELRLSFVDRDGVKELLRTRVYHDYMITWGTVVEEIKQNIKNAVERLNETEAKGDAATISEMTMAISLALNVVHHSGVIMSDYGVSDEYISKNITTSFLERLSERSVSEWEQEFHKEFGI